MNLKYYLRGANNFLRYLIYEFPRGIDFSLRDLSSANLENNGYLDFFISTANADSSLIKPKYYDAIKKVECLMLDKLLENLNLNKIKLLKLEAEGYEPEILIGAGDKVKNFEYIAVDGGYERGEKRSKP